MAFILHIESATENCSVALSKDNEILSIINENNTLRHSEIITLLISKALDTSGIKYKELSAVSISEGPGSYTSLRVGTSAAKAICYAWNLPLISVNTLYSLGLKTYITEPENNYFFPVIDARRMEVYGSLFDSKMTPVFENLPIILDEFDIYKYLGKNSVVYLSGNGADKTKEFFKESSFINTNIKCSSENLVLPAFLKFKNQDFEDTAYFSPNYIKPPNITFPKPKTL
jgi:tRNA threonylcarbamoyladenosine biosynthesis protein TsaB